MLTRFALLATAALLAGGAAAQPPALTPFDAEGTPPAPWRIAVSPKIAAHTQFSVARLDGVPALRVQTERSYANLLHPLAVDLAPRPLLRWRWRVERSDHRGDLRRKDGDDVPLQLCVLFDVPTERLTLGVQLKLRLGRALFDPALPAASICYVWDSAPGGLPAGTWLPNSHTDRVQMLVLQSSASGASLGRWTDEARDLAADFARAFPAEAAGGWLPRLVGVAIAGHGDNSGASATAYVAQPRLENR
jgi:hypothetical protein